MRRGTINFRNGIWRIAVNAIRCLLPAALLSIAMYGPAASDNTVVDIDVGEDSRIQEFVVVVSNLDLTLPAFTDVLQWDIKYEGVSDATVAISWGLPANTEIREVLVGNGQSDYGFVRLVEIDGVDQELIRPGARWWDVGGILNINVLVKDSAQIIDGLRALGWYARSMPEPYVYPGNVKGVSMIMIGPDDLMLSFQERQSPPLSGWPPMKAATHIEVGYEIVSDPSRWTEFYKNTVGFWTRDLTTRGGNDDKDIGPNDFGLPHNTRGIDYSVLGGAKPHDGEQLLGVRSFPRATGFDFSDRVRPPNIGIASIRLPVSDIDALADRLIAAGTEIAAKRQIVEMAPYGKVKVLAIRTPGGGKQWTEFFEPNAEPLTNKEFADFLRGGKSGTWAGVGGAEGKIYFNADETAKVTFGRGEATGTWALKGNAICTSWTTLRDGRESCAVYYHLSGNDFQSFQMSGKPEGLTTFD